jgi:hypothetical protein
VIDVTRRSIEETAATVLQQVELWHTKRGNQAGQPPEDPAAAVLGQQN